MDKKGKFEKMAEVTRNCCKGEGDMADCCSMMRKMMGQEKRGEKKKKRDCQKKDRNGDASIYWKKIQTIYSRQESEFIFLSSPRAAIRGDLTLSAVAPIIRGMNRSLGIDIKR